MNEFVIEWIKGKTVASVTCPSNSRLANKIRNLAENHKEFMVIRDDNEALFAHIPVSSVSIRKPTEISDEKRQELSDRMKRMVTK